MLRPTLPHATLEERLMKLKALPLLLIFVSLSWQAAWTQLKFYENTFQGGVVGGGYSIGSGVASGSGSFEVQIPAGSAILNAYLIAGRCGNAPATTIQMNGQSFQFNNSNIISTGFFTVYGGLSAVHAIEVTSSILPTTTNYTISVPTQNLISDKYADFYLYIAFQNMSMPMTNAVIHVNTTNLSEDAYSWTIGSSLGINTLSDVGLAIFGGYAEAGGDCEHVAVAGVPLGTFGGRDHNGASAWGCMAGFQYYNNTLVGYGDDNANALIDSTDVLSNIKHIIPNGSSSFTVDFAHCTPTMQDNHVWALFLTSGSGVLAAHQVDLQVQPNTSSIQLHWSVSDPHGILSYEIQRSQNGTDFSSLHAAELDANSTTDQFGWEDVTAPVGQNWYRIRFRNQDGSDFYSDVESAVLDGKTLATGLSPNPAGQGQALRIQLTEDQPIDWILYQIGQGREVGSGSHTGGAALLVSTDALSTGSYALQLRSQQRMQVLRFVVN
jgi:hypothetical protein